LDTALLCINLSFIKLHSKEQSLLTRTL
jgi:hypothetical protein